VSSLKEAQPAAEGAAPHLIDYTEKLASALRQQLKRFFGDRLQKSLETMKWPTRELNITDSLLDKWRQDVELLIDLQMPYVKIYSPSTRSQLTKNIASYQVGMR
jgi:hypothetical protein